MTRSSAWASRRTGRGGTGEYRLPYSFESGGEPMREAEEQHADSRSPSGVSWGKSSPRARLTLHPMTDVAKPVMHWAAVRAQAVEFAVINTRAARMSKASANVSTTRTPRRSRLALLSPVMPSPISR